MRIKKIGPEHARALGRLEARCYSPEFCLGWRDFQADLEEAEADNGNYSYGLFQGEEMVGYLVAYSKDEGVYVSDLAILPECRADRSLAALLGTFFRAAGEHKMVITAECRKSSFRISAHHPRFFRRLGYTLVSSQLLPRYNGGEDHWRIRFEPV